MMLKRTLLAGVLSAAMMLVPMVGLAQAAQAHGSWGDSVTTSDSGSGSGSGSSSGSGSGSVDLGCPANVDLGFFAQLFGFINQVEQELLNWIEETTGLSGESTYVTVTVCGQQYQVDPIYFFTN